MTSSSRRCRSTIVPIANGVWFFWYLKSIRSPFDLMMCLAPGWVVGPFATSCAIRLMLYGVTSSGTVRFIATDRGTPTWSMPKFGSAVMTVRAEKSTRLPMRLPRNRPSFPFRRCWIVLRGRPDRCVTCGIPRSSLFMNAATLCCNACSNCSTMMLGSPFVMAFPRAMLLLMTLTS